MKYRKLGNTELNVSVICLGTMTFGEQNSQKDGFDQMNYAVERGINFFEFQRQLSPARQCIRCVP